MPSRSTGFCAFHEREAAAAITLTVHQARCPLCSSALEWLIAVRSRRVGSTGNCPLSSKTVIRWQIAVIFTVLNIKRLSQERLHSEVVQCSFPSLSITLAVTQQGFRTIRNPCLGIRKLGDISHVQLNKSWHIKDIHLAVEGIIASPNKL